MGVKQGKDRSKGSDTLPWVVHLLECEYTLRFNALCVIIRHSYTAEGTRDSHPSLLDLQSTWWLAKLWMLQIMHKLWCSLVPSATW